MKLIQVNQAAPSLLSGELKSFEQVFYLVRKLLLKMRIRNKDLLKSSKEITVVFLTSTEMKKINKKFRGINKPTDVLSFAGDHKISLGELLICDSVLKLQAKEQGHGLNSERAYMLIHGILHLLGYDHELSQKEEKLMFSIQDRCFVQLSQVAAKYL
jgi:probable rRNA maturation factor